MKLHIKENFENLKQFNDIDDILNELNSNNYNYYAFRNATEHDLDLINSGRDYLDVSFDWVDGDITNETLNGSCGIYIDDNMSENTIRDRYNQCLKNYSGNTILLIADNNSEWGNDENEIILGSNGCGADVIGIVEL